ncbi:MAG: hypothetical protein O2820_23375 [Planctomycetota bacterium]|nr:hypothetical protein [Planctomycetota bacterium]MDA1252156.1 hypothetical protein [Planctomycetota bacterium]
MISNLQLQPQLQPLEFVAELRLRQWGRRNYVSASMRIDSDWHPVVLDEMQRKDAELLGEAPLRIIIGSAGIIPLEPSRHERIRIDQLHAALAGPRFPLRRSDQARAIPVPVRRQEPTN